MQSAGIANMIATAFSITASFLRSRYYVFRNHDKPITNQMMVLVLFFGFIACIHGMILYLWMDIRGFDDYRFGLVLAISLQVIFSYLGNKTLVFNK